MLFYLLNISSLQFNINALYFQWITVDISFLRVTERGVKLLDWTIEKFANIVAELVDLIISF